MVTIDPPRIDNGSRGDYHLVVSNPGQSTETVVLEGSTTYGQLGFRFEPAQLTLKPQGQAIATLTVWPISANPVGQTAIDFWVTAKPGSGKARPGSTQATFVHLVQAQVKQRPAWLIPVIVLAVCLLLICAISAIIILNLRNPVNSTGGALHFFNSSSFLIRSLLYGSIRIYLG
jgi:hypothetical protein